MFLDHKTDDCVGSEKNDVQLMTAAILQNQSQKRP
jgi:hypothetical protein